MAITIKNIADLAFAQSVSPQVTMTGRSVSYTFRVENTGTRTAHGISVRDELPESVAYVSAATSVGTVQREAAVVTCAIGTLPPGGSAVLTLVVIPTAPGSFLNAPVLLLDEEDGNQGNESEPVTLTVIDTDPADTDSDGILDAWEQQWFHNLTTAGVSTDFDGDGFTDRNELIAGTSPTDAASYFQTKQLSVAETGVSGTFVTTVSWQSVADRVYALERSFDLVTWVVVADAIAATPPLNSATNQSTPPAGRVFYRVKVR